MPVGYAKSVSRGEFVFVEESAESVSALDGGRWQVRATQLPTLDRRLEVE
jgi:hypothetical protein